MMRSAEPMGEEEMYEKEKWDGKCVRFLGLKCVLREHPGFALGMVMRVCVYVCVCCCPRVATNSCSDLATAGRSGILRYHAIGKTYSGAPTY